VIALTGICTGLMSCADLHARETFGFLEGTLVTESLEQLCPLLENQSSVVEFCTNYVQENPVSVATTYLSNNERGEVFACMESGIDRLCAPDFLQTAWYAIKQLDETPNNSIAWFEYQLLSIADRCWDGG
jgi:hypothetical protein